MRRISIPAAAVGYASASASFRLAMRAMGVRRRSLELIARRRRARMPGRIREVSRMDAAEVAPRERLSDCDAYPRRIPITDHAE